MWIPRVFTAIVLYTIIIVLLIIARPASMFDPAGRPKPFGLGFSRGYSVFAPCTIFPILALLVYMFVIWLRLIAN